MPLSDLHRSLLKPALTSALKCKISALRLVLSQLSSLHTPSPCLPRFNKYVSVTLIVRRRWLPARPFKACTQNLRWSGENPTRTWLKHSSVQATMGAFLSSVWHWASKVSKVQEAHDFYLKIYKLWKWMPLCLFVLHSTLKPRGLIVLASCQPISTPQKP